MRRRFPHLRVGGLGLVFGLMFAPTRVFAADLASSERALLQGRAADAIKELRAVLAQEPNNGHAHLLLCRTYYAEGLVDPAVSECEAALKTLANDSEAQDWMGRTYGVKADHAGPLSGFSLARKVKTAFEAAVNLDAGNGEAVDDLGDYYVQAPGVVGGGIDKATALADRVQAKHPERALRILALAAQKRKDYATAERQFKARVDVTRGRPDTWVDLATFYTQRGEADKAVDALHHSYAANKTKDPSLVALAIAMNKLNREPDFAQKALQDYLDGQQWNDTAPVFKARTLLGKLLASRGNKPAAKIEFEKALALAPDYEPARKALASL